MALVDHFASEVLLVDLLEALLEALLVALLVAHQGPGHRAVGAHHLAASWVACHLASFEEVPLVWAVVG